MVAEIPRRTNGGILGPLVLMYSISVFPIHQIAIEDTVRKLRRRSEARELQFSSTACFMEIPRQVRAFRFAEKRRMNLHVMRVMNSLLNIVDKGATLRHGG